MDFRKAIQNGVACSAVALLIVSAWPTQANAQLLGGIFSQKSTDLKLVGQQIALLQVYTGWLEKGYHIARQGLTLIGKIKDGEFNLHTGYFNNLSAVNPNLRRLGVVADILEQEASMRRYVLLSRSTGGLAAAEQTFFEQTGDLGRITLVGACDAHRSHVFNARSHPSCTRVTRRLPFHLFHQAQRGIAIRPLRQEIQLRLIE